MPDNSDCPFCSLPADRVIASSAAALAFRDSYPVTEGHTLVVPRAHVASLFDLTEPEQASVWSLVAAVRAQFATELGVTAFNIGVNDGVSAGQTVPHAHVHVIPRRPGDMPDPRGGVRWIMPHKARYWSKP